MRDYIPTESMIFAKYFCRDLRDREALHANHIAPGCKTWLDALPAVVERFKDPRNGKPSKMADIVRELGDYLTSDAIADNFAHLVLDFVSNKRTSALTVATLTPGSHPFAGNDEKGVNVVVSIIRTYRNGDFYSIGDLDLAFISYHAIARMHQRGEGMTYDLIASTMAYLGILGLITRGSPKHVRGELSLRYGDLLLTGSLKHVARSVEGGGIQRVNGTLLDVRTVLKAEGAHSEKIKQGEMAAHAVATWLEERPGTDCEHLAELIPFRQRRDDDYTLNSIRNFYNEEKTCV